MQHSRMLSFYIAVSTHTHIHTYIISRININNDKVCSYEFMRTITMGDLKKTDQTMDYLLKFRLEHRSDQTLKLNEYS